MEQEPSPSPAASGTAVPLPLWRRWLRPVLSILVLVAAVSFLARSLGEEGGRALLHHLRHADAALLALAAAVNLARYGLWASRWQGVIRPVVRIPWWPAWRALMASIFLNTVLPAARPLGGIVRARILRRTVEGPAGPIYGGTLVDQLGYSLMSVGLGALCLPWAFLPADRESGGGGRRWWLLLIVLAAGAVALARRQNRRRFREWLARRLPRAVEAVGGAVEAARNLLGRMGTYLWMICGGGAVWFANALSLWIAAYATGSGFSLGDAAAAWALGSLAGAVTGTPGGAGTTEWAASQFLISRGVPPSEALAAALVARGLHYISAVALGGPSFFLYRRRQAAQR